MTLLLGAAYYPEHRDPAKWEYDLQMMAEANLNSVRVGEFAWSRFEPREGDYDFSWLDTFNEQAARFGISLLVCPPLRTAPAWLVEKDPTILLERADGVRLAFGSRYTFCINHPLLRDKGAALAEALAAHYGPSDNVIGYHLDNEHGDEPDCHCEICTAKFQQWCIERYGTIAALNEAWGMVFWSLEFQHFGQVPTPRVSKTHHSPGQLLAWRRFRSACTVEAVALQADAVRKHAPVTQFITTNNQPLWNQRTDYYDMAKVVDIAGTNYYPPYRERTGGADPRAIALGLAMARSYKQQPFQVHELRNGPHMIPGAAGNTPAPGEVERLTMHVFANGANAAYYFRWRTSPFGCEQSHGSPTNYDGQPKRVYTEIQKVFAQLRRLSELIEGTHIQSEVALLVDFPTRWVMETGVHWNGPVSLYMEHTKKLYAVLRAQGINVDVVSRDQAFSPYKLLVVPALAAMDDALAERLITYVQNGGMLVWHPLSGIKDAESRVYSSRLHPRLKDMLGVDIAEFATVGEGQTVPFVWQEARYEGTLFCDLPALDVQAHEPITEAWGYYVDTWFAGMAAVARRAWGQGHVVYVTTFAQANFYRDLFAVLLPQANVTPILATPVPEAVEITERRDGAGQRFVFLLNTTDVPQLVKLSAPVEDIYNQEKINNVLNLPPFGVRVLNLMS